MVVRVHIPRQHCAVTANLVLVFTELLRRVGAAVRVDDDGRQPLQPLHALVHASRPFDGLAAKDAKSAVVSAGFHLCGIGGHALPRFNTLLHQLCGFLVGGTQPGQFVEDIQRFACRIIVAAVECPRVGIPAPVNTVFNGVEVSDSLLRDRLKPQIFKYLRTAADDLAQIFMAVFRRLRSLDVLRAMQQGLAGRSNDGCACPCVPRGRSGLPSCGWQPEG